MRIAVVNLTGGGLSGGYRKYLSRLMPLLAADRRVSALTVFVPPGATPARDLDMRPWTADDPRQGFRRLRRDVAALRPDVVFIPTARYADFGGPPIVSMVRNMEPLTVPFGGNTLRDGLRNVARAFEARRAARRATRVIAVSQFVREFVIGRWRIAESRVGTVYHGVDLDPADPVSGTEAGERTLFTAGSVRPARGLEDAIGALPRLSGDVSLVIAGGVDPGCEGYAARLRRLAARLGVAGRIAWNGHLSPAAMADAFQGSAAFVMTSRAEACPNTALEAMAAGLPSVSVAHAPMPEFFGDAALYYPAGDAAALADRLLVLLANPGEQQRLRTAARARAAAFTWETTRDRTIEELRRALS